jgi:hypothetical protein
MQYAEELCPDNGENEILRQVELIKTIRMPKKIHFLKARLPRAKYRSNRLADN